jgi:hypothetical protein
MMADTKDKSYVLRAWNAIMVHEQHERNEATQLDRLGL